MDNLVEFFSNRFYENILIQNAENEEFIILLFYLFKNEIDNMHNASLSSFLDEETKFIGKLLRSYTCRLEFKSFLRMNFNDFIINIQNEHPNIEIDTKNIFDYLKNKNKILEIKKAEMFGKNSSQNVQQIYEKTFFDSDSLGKSIKRSSLLSTVN